MALALSTVNAAVLASLSTETLEQKIIKDIRITGIRHTQEYIITRELISKVGQVYKEENIKEDYRRLDRLGIFSEVIIHPKEEEDGFIINIEIKETFPFMPSVIVKFSDEDGIQYGGGFKSVNFKGRAIYLSGLLLLGQAKQVIYKIRNPWISGNHLSYNIEYFHRNRQNALFDFKEIADEVYFTLSSYLGKNGRIGGRFLFQGIESDIPGQTLSDDNIDNVPMFGFFLGYDSRDFWSNPHTGWWNEIEVLKSIGLIGDSDFWRLTLDIRRFIPIANHHTLVLSSLTSLTSGTVGEDVAAWQQFGVGGTNSIRGWELASRTGKNQFINTIEYRYNVLEPKAVKLFGLTMSAGVQIAAFTDFGHAWNYKNEFKFSNFIAGYGVGMRLLIPFSGIARLDVAWGQPGLGIRLHIGSYEKSYMQRQRVR